MTVASEKATVYRGGGRRWFTLQAACNAEARAKINERCECDCSDYDTSPVACALHEEERYSVIRRRLARVYRNAYKARKAGGDQ